MHRRTEKQKKNYTTIILVKFGDERVCDQEVQYPFCVFLHILGSSGGGRRQLC